MPNPRTLTDIDFSAYRDELMRSLPPSIFGPRLGYSERICLERWVSECEPVFIYGSGLKLRGIGLAGGDGTIFVHAPPTDKFYIAAGTGYPPDWDFYTGRDRVWLPIATAPHDASWVEIRWDWCGAECVAQFVDIGTNGERNVWVDEDGENQPDPTHWRAR